MAIGHALFLWAGQHIINDALPSSDQQSNGLRPAFPKFWD
jgi:hypothetical protein